MSTVRMLVADDHEVVRRGVRTLLEAQPGWQVSGEADNGREAVEKAKALKPDVVVLDIAMPELNGLEATSLILKAVPVAQVLILTMHDSEQLVRRVLGSGARGYVLKSDAARDLVAAIEALLQHKLFFSSRISEVVLEEYLRSARHSRPEASEGLLTMREREIVQLLAEGNSNKEIASTLGIKLKTVETHRANITRKLGVHSVGELVRYAIRNKMVQP